MNEFKTIILCADDFGLNQGISQGILKLLRLNRLSAVSCMVNVPGLIQHAKELLSFKNQIQLGMHFNLTEGHFVSDPQRRCFNFNKLLIKSNLRVLGSTFVAKEFNAQLDQYIRIMGCLPDFIDGHQHVHQFPQIRSAVLDLYEQRLRQYKTSVRSTWPAISLPQYRFKTRILTITGGRALQGHLTRSGIPHNQYFSGVYDFNQATNYRVLFRQWLSLVPSDTLIMCHPGEGEDAADDIAPARVNELNYLAGDEFLEDCQEYKIQLTT